MAEKENSMKGKVIPKKNTWYNTTWYVKFENGITRKFIPTSFFGDLGYVIINGKKINVEVDMDNRTAKTY